MVAALHDDRHAGQLGTFICVYIGAGWTIKVQYFILAILVASLGSFYAGAIADFNPSTAASELGRRTIRTAKTCSPCSPCSFRR